jgi:hypothetical protein
MLLLGPKIQRSTPVKHGDIRSLLTVNPIFIRKSLLQFLCQVCRDGRNSLIGKGLRRLGSVRTRGVRVAGCKTIDRMSCNMHGHRMARAKPDERVT